MLRNLVQRVYKDSLFLNSIYLMAATAVMALFGFIFWLIVARLFSTTDIGLATALISVMNFVTYLSLIGFNVAFVRFLPKSEKANEEVNTGMLLVALAAGLLATAFVVLVSSISPALDFIRGSSMVALMFIVFCIFAALNTLTDAYFLAYRQTKFTFIINTVFSVIKMVLPFLFIGGGAIGVFAAAAGAQAIGFILSIAIMMVRFGYRPQFVIHGNFLAREWKYCAGNYVASIFNLLPVVVLPIIITNHLGPEQAAYYYMATMIGNLLYVIPTATTRSLFAEGSADEKQVAASVKMSVIFITLLLAPAILVTVVSAPYILQIFGHDYVQGALFLQLLALAGIFISMSSIFSALFQLRKDTKAVIVTNCCYALTVVGCSYMLLSLGLEGVGLALIAGSIVSNIAGFILYNKFAQIGIFFTEFFYEERARIVGKIKYFQARRRNGGRPVTVLFYPEMPKPFHMLYVMCHELGYKMSNNLNAPYDVAVAFEDTDVRMAKKSLAELCEGKDMINAHCQSIGKSNVGEVFEKVFGYATTINPQMYHGKCVRKSTGNAVHDGQVVECPCEPEEGYVYQKLINNEYGSDMVRDIRVMIFKDTISIIHFRYRSLFDRFDNTTRVVIGIPSEALSPQEQAKILEFCKEFGLEYGDLDVLRDNNDGKIYIVDVNNAPSGPLAGTHLSKADYKIFITKLCNSFVSSFVVSSR